MPWWNLWKRNLLCSLNHDRIWGKWKISESLMNYGNVDWYRWDWTHTHFSLSAPRVSDGRSMWKWKILSLLYKINQSTLINVNSVTMMIVHVIIYYGQSSQGTEWDGLSLSSSDHAVYNWPRRMKGNKMINGELAQWKQIMLKKGHCIKSQGVKGHC